MASMYRPVVDKLSLLVKNFENRVTIKNSKTSRGTMVASKSEGDNSAENTVLLKYDASVLSRTELDALFAPVTKRLASLKTVDEISNKPEHENEGSEEEKNQNQNQNQSQNQNQNQNEGNEGKEKGGNGKDDSMEVEVEVESNHIDVSKHLAEHLQNSRAYTRLDDGRLPWS